jgi:hypothetical protein
MEETIPHPSSRISRGAVPHLFCLRLVALLDHLAPTVATAALADAMSTHQLVALRADHQRRRIQALMLSPVATAMARNFCLWYGTHECILIPFLTSFVFQDVRSNLFSRFNELFFQVFARGKNLEE